MVKGYDQGDNVSYNQDELKNRFLQIEKESILSANEKTNDFVVYGKLEKAKIEMYLYVLLLDIIRLNVKKVILSEELGIEDNIDLKSLLKNMKIQKCDDVEKQIEVIQHKIAKCENEINELVKKIQDKNPGQSDFDLDEQIVNVKIGLEVDFDERKTSLYQYQIYVKALIKKIEQLNKINNK